MKTEEVTAAVDITAGQFGAREKGERFTIPTSAAVDLEKAGIVTRQKAAEKPSA